jgi:hypothetical protein|nr:MAG TPA: hypothetical protein [Caudoviricetes sp.]
MQIKKANYSINGYPNSHFFISETGLTTTTLTQMSKFTQGEVIEINAPVWQLCDSRHENPIANMGGIFPKCLANPLDMRGMKSDILDKIRGKYGFGDTLFCVVTGMSSALISLVNACSALDVRLRLLHYDVVHDCYKMQLVDNYYLEEKITLIKKVMSRKV